MKARLKDVAALAGVAPNTASTILNRRPNSWASKETEERVFKAAKELGYRPSRAAKGLRLGCYHTIGLVVMDLHNPFYTAFADQLERALAKNDYDLIIEHSRADFQYEYHCLQSILDRQVDAVTYFVSDYERHLEFLNLAKKENKPVVALTATSGDTPFPFDAVEIDFQEGMQAAIGHLIKLGHRRFCFLCSLAKGQSAGDRLEFYRNFLAEEGISSKDFDFISCSHQLGSARDCFGEYLDRSGAGRATALIAMNDLSAIGAMRAAWDRGLDVPRDLSVVGVDNILLGDFMYKPLTTIEQRIEELAAATAKMLIARLQGDDRDAPPRRCRVKAQFVRKETTAPPPCSE